MRPELKRNDRAHEVAPRSSSIVRIDPSRSLALRLRAAIGGQRSDEALSLYEQLSIVQPREPRWPHHRGDLLRRLERVDEALLEYERAEQRYEEREDGTALAMLRVVRGLIEPPEVDDAPEPQEPELTAERVREVFEHSQTLRLVPELDVDEVLAADHEQDPSEDGHQEEEALAFLPISGEIAIETREQVVGELLEQLEHGDAEPLLPFTEEPIELEPSSTVIVNMIAEHDRDTHNGTLVPFDVVDDELELLEMDVDVDDFAAEDEEALDDAVESAIAEELSGELVDEPLVEAEELAWVVDSTDLELAEAEAPEPAGYDDLDDLEVEPFCREDSIA